MNKVTADIGVAPAWLAARLADGTNVRVVDVRTDADGDESGPRLRTGNTVDLRAFGFGPAGWRASRERHSHRGPPKVLRARTSRAP